MSRFPKRTVLLVTGMKCNSCREIVSHAMQGIPGVDYVHVDLFRAVATIVHDATCEPDHLVSAVRRAGYGASRQTEEPIL